MGSDDQPRPALLPVLLSVIAGLGHLVLGRARRGLLLFVGATAGWNVAFLSRAAPNLPLGEEAFRLGLGVGAGLTLYAIIDTVRLAIIARLPFVRRRRSRLLQQAIDHYLRHEFREARTTLDRLLDIDPGDPLARLYLATLERRAGHPERALHHTRKALRAWPSNRYQPEIEREAVLAQETRRGR